MSNSEVFYPDVQNGSYIFKAFADVKFADRALVIVEPGQENWALHIIRQGNTLRMFDDFSWQHWRRMEGINHSINYMGYDGRRAEGTAEDFYKDVGLGGRPCEERPTSSIASAYLTGLAWDWANSRRDKPGISEEKAQARIEKLFFDHLGVDYNDIIAAGGKYDEGKQNFVDAKPLSEIALRPLPSIPDGLRKRFDFV